MLNSPESKIWPHGFTLPPRHVRIEFARIVRTGDQQILTLKLAIDGNDRRETLVAGSLFDLVARLSMEIGFTASDAFTIVNLAEQAEPAAAGN